MISLKKKMLMALNRRLNVDEVFATTLYTDGTAAGQLVPLPFNPDFVWHKLRAATSSHRVFDSLRGQNFLQTQATDSQVNIGSETGTTRVGGFNKVNFGAGGSVVGWAAKRAPRFFDIRRVTLPAGNSNFRIPHGLEVTPGLIIGKRISDTGNWLVFHRSRGAGNVLLLNTTAAESASTVWSGGGPTETDFGVNTSATGSGEYIFKLFAHDPDPDGIIQCGQYTGNGSTTGPVVTLGWEPQWLLIKCATAVSDWVLRDNKRDTANPRNIVLYPNTSSAEVTNTNENLNFTTTGFQPLTAIQTMNATGQVYTYMAIRKGAA